MHAISVNNLKKYYQVHHKEPGLGGSFKSFFLRQFENVKAVDDISFGIDEGELVGFIGPNGAGKTTTLKCLAGLLYPDSGLLNVLGHQPWERKHEYLRKIALVMGQKNQLWWDLPPRETFLLNKEIYEVSEVKYQKTLNDLVDLLTVRKVLDTPVRKLSLGQRMKCELIASLIHSPKVLFLDEPTIGLDVIAQKNIRDFIKTYNKRYKATIILTSHYMGDVKELCERVLIIDRGKLVFDGKLQEIIEKYSDHKIIKVVFAKEIDPKKLAKIAQVKKYHFPSAVLIVKREASNAAAAQLLKDFPVGDLNIEEPAIEDIIREVFTGRDLS